MFEKFINGVEEELNVSTTENGALGYKTTGKALLDFNFKVASYRNMSEDKIIADFKKAWYENKELALKCLFYVRDIREGLGERRLFRLCINSIVDELDERVFDWIAEYGRYDDLFAFFYTKMQDKMMQYVKDQLFEDMQNCLENKPVSLLAKWMPSIKTSSKDAMTRARLFIDYFNSKEEGGVTQKDYRKTLSKLRSYIDVVEKKCCSNKWSEINYETVPSNANLKYKDAFMKHDQKRRTEYLESLSKGETKINASVVYPHDIVANYDSSNYHYMHSIKRKDTTLEEMWKSLPDYVQGNANTLVVRDGSGSMTSYVTNNAMALHVSTALAIYFSERCDGVFKDKFITFSASPRMVDLKNYESLHDKLQCCYAEDDCTNTNIEKTFKLVLNTAIKNNLKQEEIPTLLIISDMEFDTATFGARSKKLFERIADDYEEHGYKLPKLVFWNVNSRTCTVPITQNDAGVILVSGFSTTICKMILQEETDPYKALLNVLESDRYKQITLQKQ